MNFANPLWFAALIPVVFFVFLKLRVPQAHLRMASLKGQRKLASKSHAWVAIIPLALRILAVFFIIIALARPREGLERTIVRHEGIDIVLAIDVSGSMRAEDFQLQGDYVNRLEIIKHVVKDFIERRPNDRIGVVVFAGAAYIQSPPTLDHDWLSRQLEHTYIGMLGEDGTAIGTALGTSLNRLRDSDAKSRIIVLLTDGENNAGKLSPATAASLAADFGVKVYTVGVGSKGWARVPQQTVFGTRYARVQTNIDEAGLTQIAEMTGGRYFRATDTDSLEATYAEIDKLEQSEMENPTYMVYNEFFQAWLLAAMSVLALEFLLARTWFRVLP